MFSGVDIAVCKEFIVLHDVHLNELLASSMFVTLLTLDLSSIVLALNEFSLSSMTHLLRKLKTDKKEH